MRRFLSAIVVLGCLAPLSAEANPYAAYVAKYLGEYLLGKCLDEVWDAATGAPDVTELDLRLRAFENALSQVDAQLSARIAELRRNIGDARRQIAKRPTRDEVRQIVQRVLSELESRIAELERRADRIEQKIAQFEEVFGIVTMVPPAPLIRSSVEAGNPAVHPLTADWARLLCECETSRLKLYDLRLTLQEDHPDVQVALQADEAVLGRIAACHAKVLEESVKRIDERMDLLRVERLKPTHPKVRLVDDNLASLLWLRAVSKPVPSGPQKGRLSMPQDMIGPKCSEILAAFRLADADVTVLAPLFRHLLSVPLEQAAGGSGTIPEDMAQHVAKTQTYLDRMGQLWRETKETDAELKAVLREYSELHESVKALRMRQRTLIGQVRRAQEVSEEALSAALVAYVAKLQYERPTNPRMLAFRAQVLLPLNELADLTACSDWDNRIAMQGTWERVLQAKSFTSERNSIGIKLVLIQPGEFLMGSSDGDADEKPPHKVKITKPFYLGVTEVTQEQYERVMGTNPSKFQGDPRRPVENVSFKDAVEFCRKLTERERLSGKSGPTYRLPTEAEWEYACRAGTTTTWCCGDDESALADYAWYGNANGQTHAVAQKKPNAWGLYDMHGNVWEWCADWYADEYYARSPSDDPVGPDEGWPRVFRGGGWYCQASECRASERPVAGRPNDYIGFGFRLARTVSFPSTSR